MNFFTRRTELLQKVPSNTLCSLEDKRKKANRGVSHHLTLQKFYCKHPAGEANYYLIHKSS